MTGEKYKNKALEKLLKKFYRSSTAKLALYGSLIFALIAVARLVELIVRNPCFDFGDKVFDEFLFYLLGFVFFFLTYMILGVARVLVMYDDKKDKED